MRHRTPNGTVVPTLEIARRVSVLLDCFESRDLAAKLGVSETSALKLALGRPVYRDTLRQAERRLDDVEREAGERWQARMIERTGARPVLLSNEEPLS